jgi:ribosomal protein S3AE
MIGIEMSDDEIRRIEARWKSDIEKKVDSLVAFASEYQDFLRILIKREQRRLEFREAVIQKSVIALVMSGIGFVCALVYAGAKTEIVEAMAAIKDLRK